MTLSDLVNITASGYFFADYPSFLAWLTSQYQAIYGADVYIDPDSLDGQFLAIVAQALYDTAALGGSVYNSFSPVTAQGVGLSRNVKINGLTRQAATNSTVDLTIVGAAGTTITNGVAQDTLQQQWNLPASVTIPGGGTITVTSIAVNPGAVSALANTITSIFTPTLGWQTVNNASAATVGLAAETDAALRARQAVSTANPSLTVLEGQEGAVANVPGVTAVRAYENDTNSTDANTVPAHTVSLIVAGGDSMVVAQTIALHKTPGCGTYGTTSELVYDSHGMPLTINFYRPTIATIAVNITIAATPNYSSDYTQLIKNAIAAQIDAFGIGNNVIITQLYAPAYLNGSAAGQTYTVSSLQINKNGGGFSGSNVTIAFNEEPFCDPLINVSVTVT